MVLFWAYHKPENPAVRPYHRTKKRRLRPQEADAIGMFSCLSACFSSVFCM